MDETPIFKLAIALHTWMEKQEAFADLSGEAVAEAFQLAARYAMWGVGAKDLPPGRFEQFREWVHNPPAQRQLAAWTQRRILRLIPTWLLPWYPKAPRASTRRRA